MRTLRWKRRLVLNVPCETAWRLASDTARFNKATGLPPVTFTQLEGDGYGHLRAETRYLGIPFRWHEYPFNWVHQEHHSVLRAFDGTPIRSIRTTVSLRDTRLGQTMVEMRVEIVPRTVFGWLVSHLLVGARILKNGTRVLRGFETAAASPVDAYPQLGRPVVRVSELRRLGERLHGMHADSALVDRLLAHIETAPDDAVTAMRPFALADRWGASRQDVLKLCLRATRAGLLELRWDVLCPNCRVSKVQAYALKDVQGTAHCETCHMEFGASFDESVELRFSVCPTVRSVMVGEFCIGGPANTRHVLAQQSIDPGAVQAISLTLRAGSYWLRMPGAADRVRLQVSAESKVDHLDVTVEDDVAAPPSADLAAGQVTVTIRNHTARRQLVRIEETAWSAHFASAALVTSLQDFRDLFSTEVLAPGLGLGVRNLTFLFTDVKGSTSFYQQSGDAPAFARVRDHFAVLTEAIEINEGALVKTIGDAVMAVFSAAPCAIAAALAMHEGMRALNERDPRVLPLQVKIGLHAGPCIAVTANGVLDYFGTTVNTAARVQGLADAGEVLVTRAVLEDADVSAQLSSGMLIAAPFAAELRGLSGTAELFRLVRVESRRYSENVAISS
jgi:adenylate cyclase